MGPRATYGPTCSHCATAVCCSVCQYSIERVADRRTAQPNGRPDHTLAKRSKLDESTICVSVTVCIQITSPHWLSMLCRVPTTSLRSMWCETVCEATTLHASTPGSSPLTLRLPLLRNTVQTDCLVPVGLVPNSRNHGATSPSPCWAPTLR